MTAFTGKWTLITGASSGIGKAFAEHLAREGAKLVLVARGKEALESLASTLKQQHGTEVIIISKDLSRLEAPQEILDELKKTGISIEGLINNAGMGVFGKLHQTDLQHNQQLLMLNVLALASLTQLFLPEMVERKSGIIINISSTASFLPLAYMSNYAASKAYVRSFTEALWAENQHEGLQFLCVCPGATATNFFKAMGTQPDLGKAEIAERVVKQALKALDQHKIVTICGSFIKNFVRAQAGRFVTQKFLAKMGEAVMRQRHSK